MIYLTNDLIPLFIVFYLHTMYTVLDGINLVLLKQQKISTSNVTCKKLYGGEVFQILVIFLQDLGLLPIIYPCVLLFDLQKKA